MVGHAARRLSGGQLAEEGESDGEPARPALRGGDPLPEALWRALGRPEPFAPHDAPFWDDPYIASQMLRAHLDPSTDAASRRPETIRATVTHLVRAFGLEPGSRLLDLGCGPGLYAAEFARLGIRVTGLDLSGNSIRYAVEQAARTGLDVEYRAGDYTRVDLGGPYDAAVLIYLDFGVLSDDARERLLSAVSAALRPGGVFVFDVQTPARRRVADGHLSVDHSAGGFWRPHPHLVIETTYRYAEHLDLDQHTVVDGAGITTYRIWDRGYSARQLQRLLARHRMRLLHRWSDLTGTPWHRHSPTIAVAAVLDQRQIILRAARAAVGHG